MNFLKPLGLALLLLALSACATVGNTTLDQPGRYDTLREGQSTKQDIYASFGQPHDVHYPELPQQTLQAASTTQIPVQAPGNASTWVYYKLDSRPSAWSFIPYVGLLAGGSSRDITTAYFSFDAERYLGIETRARNEYSNRWAGFARRMGEPDADPQAERVKAEMVALGQPFDATLAESVSRLQDRAAE